jgi:hypothetical protein
MPELADIQQDTKALPEIADIQGLTGAEQASTQPSTPTTPQQPAQPPPAPTTAVPDPTNPDAPQKPLVDPNTGQANTDYGQALQYVTAFDNYIKGGGDITKFNSDDFDGLQAAVDSIPGFENQTSSPSVMYARFREGKDKNIAVDAGKRAAGQQGLVPLATSWGSAIGSAIFNPNTPGAILNAGKDLLWNTGKFVYDKTVGSVAGVQDVGDMLHGDFSLSHTQDLEARQTNALVETVADKWNQYIAPALNNAGTFVGNIAGDISKGDYGAIPGEFTPRLPQGMQDLNSLYGLASARATAANPDQAAHLDFKQSEIIRGQIARDQQTQANVTGARDKAADFYKWIGAGDFAQRMMKQQPDQSDMYVLGMALDPTTYLAGPAESAIKGAGEKIAGSFIKAGFRTGAIEESAAAVSAVEHQLSGVNAARTNLVSILAGDGQPLSDVTRSGFESNLQRLNSVQAKLEADRANLLGQHQDALVEANKQMDQAAKASPLRQIVGGLIQGVGGAGELPSQIGNVLASIPKAIVDRLMPTATDEVKASVVSGLKGWGQVGLSAAGAAVGAPHGLEGVIAGITGGGLAGKVVSGTVDVLHQFSHAIRTIGEQYAIGQQTLPFWKQMSEQLHGIPSWLASKMDNPLVYSIPAQATGAIAGAGLMGGQALVAGGGNTQKFQQGLASGAVIGAAGGGLGQLSRFNSTAELRQMAIGDRGRFLGSLTKPNKDLYLQLHPEYQLALATYGMAHPDLAMQFVNEPGGSNGSYTLNPNPIAKINIAADNPLAAVASHEVAHHIAAHNLGDTVDSYIRGNPVTGQAGIMSALGPDGKPMLQPVMDASGNPTGKMEYVPNAQFEAYKADYNARKLRDNPGQPPENDYGIAQEMFAELHAEHLTGREAMQKVARGYVPSDLVSENVTSNWLTKMGMGADPITGNPIPTGALEGAKGLQNVINDYYRQRQYKKLPLETGTERGGTPVQVGQIVKGTPDFDRIQTNLDSSGDLHRNPDGTIAVDLSGRPRVKTSRQADADAAQMGQRINDLYQRQPGLEGTDNDNYLKVVTDRDGRQFRRGQRVPEAVFNELAASNQFNSNQLLNWRKMDGMMQRNDGSMMNTVYNTASKGKGRYATLPARERSLIPIYSEVSLHNDQVNIKAYDPELLQANLNKRLRSTSGRQLYDGKIGPAYADVRTYLDNLAAGRPGETGLSPERKGFVNELFGFNADANPYVNELTKRSPDVFKSFRLDRINRLAEIPSATEPFHAQTYEQVRGYMQPRAEPVAQGNVPYSETPDSETMRPLGYRAAIRMPNGEVFPGGTHEAAYAAAGQPHYNSGAEYGFQHRQSGEFVTYPQADKIMEDAAGTRYQPRTGAVKNPSERVYQAASDVPKGERTPEEHDIMAARTMYEWNSQKDTVPLVARRGDDGHVITDKDGNVQYKTQDFGLLDAPVVQGLIKKYGKEEGFQRAKDLLAGRLADQYKKWEADPDLHPAIGWYSGMRDRLQASFGATIDKFANMLAATSAQEGVKTNFNYTIEALRKMSKGDYDDLMSNFREYAQQVTDRVMGDDSIKNKAEVLRKEINKFGNPKGGDIGDVPLKDNGKKYGINSQKVLHALTDYWVDQAGGPKTSNFGENLSWRSIDPTVDVWASRTARRLLYEGDVKRWRLHPAAEGGAGGRTKSGHDDYTLAESGYRGAANQVGMNPDDTQAFMWFGEKKHYADRGWTVGTGATLGDFRNIMDQMNFQRYQAGLTTNRGETAEAGAPKLLAARRDMEKTIQGLGNGVVAQRVTTSQGRYGDYNEPTLDTEFTTKQGQDVSSVENKIKEIAKAHDQDAAFLSRIHDDPNAPGARQIVEMGFNKPATPEEIDQWVGAFKKYGLGGFTVARDSRGKALGIRAQEIPEFDPSIKPEEYERYRRQWKIKLKDLRADPSLPHRNITYDKDRYADTKIFRKGEHY